MTEQNTPVPRATAAELYNTRIPLILINAQPIWGLGMIMYTDAATTSQATRAAVLRNRKRISARAIADIRTKDSVIERDSRVDCVNECLFKIGLDLRCMARRCGLVNDPDVNPVRSMNCSRYFEAQAKGFKFFRSYDNLPYTSHSHAQEVFW